MNLLPFQQQAVDEAIARNGRALLALEMGCGKTPISITVAAHFSKFPTLIICPASLKINWKREVLEWMPFLSDSDVTILDKTFVGANAKVIIASYDFVTKYIIELAQISPPFIIVDESHCIKNPKARRTKAIIPLCIRAQHVLLLTGTPILNRPIELWAQLEALSFSVGTYWKYAQRYCAAHRGRFGWDVTGASNLSELNALLRKGPMIRRLKAEVLSELPPKRRVRLSVGGLSRSPKGEALIKQCRKALTKHGNNVERALDWLRSQEYNFSTSIFEAYAELGKAKADVAGDVAADIAEQSPLVIFAHHVGVVSEIATKLNARGVSFSTIVGSTPTPARQKAVDAFQSGDVQAIILSINAASTGITLTRSSDMLITELPFTPSIALQAEDRIHRIGQSNASLIRYLCADNTIDSTLWRMICDKSTVASELLDRTLTSEFTETKNAPITGYWGFIEGILNSLVNFEIKELAA